MLVSWTLGGAFEGVIQACGLVTQMASFRMAFWVSSRETCFFAK